jgi:MFS family permease
MTDDVAASGPGIVPAGDGAAAAGADAAGTDGASESSQETAERETAERRYLVGTRRGADLLAVSLMLIFMTGAVTLSLMPVVTEDLQDRFGYSSADIGLLTSVFMGFYGVSGILSGVFAARWGGRLLAVCCGCFVIGSTVFGLSSNFAGFLIGKSIQGIGGGMVVAICGPVMAAALPPNYLGRAWGIFGSGWGLGSTATLLIMPSIERAAGSGASF